jgi:hypothetical protein
MMVGKGAAKLPPLRNSPIVYFARARDVLLGRAKQLSDIDMADQALRQ